MPKLHSLFYGYTERLNLRFPFGFFILLDLNIFSTCLRATHRQRNYKKLQKVAEFVEQTLRMLCKWKNIEILEMNVKEDHIHMILSIPSRLSISEVMGMLKGKTAIKLFKSFPTLRKKPYWGNHFWSRGYCVSSIGLDENKIRKYIKYQEEKEKREESDQQEFGLF